MKTAFAKPTNRTQSYTKFATPLVLESPRHSGLGAILLSRGKHLLGTSDDCTVPLRASDVQARHAMIVVSEHRTVVKALDPRTWVNDGPVSEMALRPGDRLSIGPLTFRVRAADADELASFYEIPEQSFPDDSFPESAPVLETPAKAVKHHDAARELPFPVPTAQEMAKSIASAMPLPAPVSGPLPSFNPSATPRDGSPVAEIKVPEINSAEIKPVPPPLPSTMETVASLLPPPAPVPIVNVIENTAVRPREASIEDTAATATLDLKLDEIQRTLSELQLPMELPSTTAASDNAVRADALTSERRQFTVRQDELQRRADELSRQSQLLHERVARVAEREVEVERSLARLALEHEQLATTAEVTRKELDDEYSRHMALWQEWDAAYRRTSGELNGQLQTMEQRRTTLLAEGDRLANERSELQRLQAEHERDRRFHAAERVQLTTDRAALQSLRAEFDTERQQHLVAVQEREARVAAERTALVGTQEELLATRQQLERERSEFLAVRSTEALRREQELREHVERREQLDIDHTRIQTRMLEMNELERVLAAERTALAAQRDEFARQQSDIAADREELLHLRSRLHSTAATLLQLQRERADFKPTATTFTDPVSQTHDAVPSNETNELAWSIPQPPPIPANWEEEGACVTGVVEEPIPAARFADLQSLSHRDTLPTNTLNVAETSLGDPMSMVSGAVPSLLESASEDRAASAIRLPEREFAPAASTVHRFWEDNTLYDTSVEASPQPPLPSRFAASSNLMSAEAAPPQESASTEVSNAKPSLDELLANVSRGLAAANDSSLIAVETELDTEFESQVEMATAIAEPPSNADETLAEINRQFGFPIAAPHEEMMEPRKPALPSWWSDSAPAAHSTAPEQSFGDATASASLGGHADSLHHSFDPPTEIESLIVPAAESSSSDSLHNLRAQLAQMFDLNVSEQVDAAEDDATSQDDSGLEYNSAEVVAGEEELEAMSQRAEAPELDLSAESAANREEQCSVQSIDSTVVEFSMATASDEPGPAVKPATQTEANGEEEDSMETYLARLLSRTRGTDVSEQEVKSLTTKSMGTTSAPKSSNSSHSDEFEPSVAFDPADRSHLTAEPKHKQDRQAAREDLQQFRQVAHQSARSALARHTSKALLSAVIAKSMLLGISVTALCAYVGAPLMGLASPAWKGVACTFTTGLCIMEVHRSWLQLHGWRKTGELPVKKASPAKSPVAPSVEVDLAAGKSAVEMTPAS